MSEPAFKFRPSQYDIINYTRGLMGVAAVPGSGKTFTLSHLAAQLVQRLTTRNFKDEREVLIVTFTNSAVNSFKSRIAHILQHERGLLPYTGYRVRTLHGLAHDIVRERPTLVGLAEDFRIVDERVSNDIQRDAVQAQLPRWSDQLELLVDDSLEDKQLKQVMHRYFPETLENIARQFISRAKSLRLSPDDLQRLLTGTADDFALSRFATAVYFDYQRSLSYRGAVDFDDLVRLAIQALASDEKYLQRLQKKWPYILEDEAQDSSSLQEEMLSLLSGEKNWVRVGDPNQAINTTFTTADPQFLRNFLERDDTKSQPLDVSGRSAAKIINLANELVKWTVRAHPLPELRDAFFYQEIQPTLPGDAQQNPRDDEANIYIHPPDKPLAPDEELQMVVSNLSAWLASNPGQTVAILVPENSRGYQMAETLRLHGINYEELLRSSTETRQTARLLHLILDYLADPRHSRKLADVYHAIWLLSLSPVYDPLDEEHQAIAAQISDSISKTTHLERLVALEEREALSELIAGSDYAAIWYDDLWAFLQMVKRWLDATLLPIDQLVLTISGDLMQSATDIALSYKIAAVLKGIARDNPGFRLPQFVEELRRISENERKFIGFDDSEQGYEPRPEVVTISTMHAAKGLEWDRVYLMSVNNYSFPSGGAADTYIGEKWFAKNGINMDAEAMAQLQAAVDRTTDAYVLGEATEESRIAYSAERLRLLYVGITRAKRQLIITWNTGRFHAKGGLHVKKAALALYRLQEVHRV